MAAVIVVCPDVDRLPQRPWWACHMVFEGTRAHSIFWKHHRWYCISLVLFFLPSACLIDFLPL